MRPFRLRDRILCGKGCVSLTSFVAFSCLLCMLGCRPRTSVEERAQGHIVMSVGSKGRVMIDYSSRGDYAKAFYTIPAASGEEVIVLSEGAPAELIIHVGGSDEHLGLRLGSANFSMFCIKGAKHYVLHDGKSVALVPLWRRLGKVNRSFKIIRLTDG